MKQLPYVILLFIFSFPQAAVAASLHTENDESPARNNSHDLVLHAKGSGCVMEFSGHINGEELNASLSETCSRKASRQSTSRLRNRLLRNALASGKLTHITHLTLDWNPGESGVFVCDLMRHASASTAWHKLLAKMEIPDSVDVFYGADTNPPGFLNELGEFARTSAPLRDLETIFTEQGYRLKDVVGGSYNLIAVRTLKRKDQACLTDKPLARLVPTYLTLTLTLEKLQ